MTNLIPDSVDPEAAREHANAQLAKLSQRPLAITKRNDHAVPPAQQPSDDDDPVEEAIAKHFGTTKEVRTDSAARVFRTSEGKLG